MADSEVGNEVNIRIEVENELYENQDGEENELMEEDTADVPVPIEWKVKEQIDDFALPFHADPGVAGVQANKIIPLTMEDGECSSNSSGTEEKMDVGSSGFFPDGENPLHQKPLPSGPRQPRRYPNPYVTDEMQKRVTRALRFGDSSFKYTPNVEELTKPTDEELLNLYVSMGLMIEDGGAISVEKVNPVYRLDSVLIRGINKMSTEEIFGYLYEQGLVPREMEWVNDACCVVIYEEKYEAAASLLKVTKPIAVDPELVEKKKSLLAEDIPSLDDEETQNRKNSSSSIQKTISLDYDDCSVIPHEAITIPMPLGHVWRFANPKNDKAKGILMRFAKTDDKKQERAEKHSEYYKKFGNPNNSSYRTDESGRHKGNRRFKRARKESIEVPSSSSEEEVEINNKNAWSVLSASWKKEETGKGNSQNRVRDPIPSAVEGRPMYSMGLTSQSRKYQFQQSAGASRVSSIHRRLGAKENKSFDNDLENVTKVIRSTKPSLAHAVSRKRGWSDEEDKDQSPSRSFEDGEEDDDDEWKTRLSRPRMKMHADEEESRQKLQAIRRTRIDGRGTVFTRGRLNIPNITRTHWEIDSNERRPVKERLGLLTAAASYVPRHQNLSEDDNDDEQDLRELLDRT